MVLRPDPKVTHVLVGSLSLKDGFVEGSDGCEGDGGYDDIREGAQVVVRSQGKTIATTDLGSGRRVDGACAFLFLVSELPDAEFYSVEVSHRGGLEYSRDQMEATDWEPTISLGG